MSDTVKIIKSAVAKKWKLTLSVAVILGAIYIYVLATKLGMAGWNPEWLPGYPLSFVIDLAVVPVIIIIFGITAAVSAYSVKTKSRNGVAAGAAGAGLGLLAAVCPVCGLLLFTIAGLSGVVTFLTFFRIEFTAIALLLSLVGLYLSARNIKCRRCHK